MTNARLTVELPKCKSYNFTFISAFHYATMFVWYLLILIIIWRHLLNRSWKHGSLFGLISLLSLFLDYSWSASSRQSASPASTLKRESETRLKARGRRACQIRPLPGSGSLWMSGVASASLCTRLTQHAGDCLKEPAPPRLGSPPRDGKFSKQRPDSSVTLQFQLWSFR